MLITDRGEVVRHARPARPGFEETEFPLPGTDDPSGPRHARRAEDRAGSTLRPRASGISREDFERLLDEERGTVESHARERDPRYCSAKEHVSDAIARELGAARPESPSRAPTCERDAALLRLPAPQRRRSTVSRFRPQHHAGRVAHPPPCGAHGRCDGDRAFVRTHPARPAHPAFRPGALGAAARRRQRRAGHRARSSAPIAPPTPGCRSAGVDPPPHSRRDPALASAARRVAGSVDRASSSSRLDDPLAHERALATLRVVRASIVAGG